MVWLMGRSLGGNRESREAVREEGIHAPRAEVAARHRETALARADAHDA